jgi:glycerol-3-phosphate dehydrogenase
MVHGGIRYLENGEFRLVREAIQERNRLIRNAPQYVKPLATVIPIFKVTSGLLNAPLKFLNILDKPSERGAVVIKAGLTMYDAYTQDDAVPKHDFDRRRKSLARYPKLNPKIVATATYYDAAMPSPERILIDVLRDGSAEGKHAHALNYVSAVGAEADVVVLRDQLTGGELRVRPKLVINAAGPWIDFANENIGRTTRFIGGTKGSHLVLDHPELHDAIQGREFFFENEDGRIVLIYPLLDKVLIGTSDLPIENPDEAICTEEEVDYFFDLVDRVFPTIRVSRQHIVHRFSGVRPLPHSSASSTGQISRDHSNKIIEPTENRPYAIFNLIGGKWTTFRAFSEQTTDAALKRLALQRKESTAQLPIGGGKNYPSSEVEANRWVASISAETEIDPTWLHIWLERYGTRAAEIAHFAADQPRADSPLQFNPNYSHHEIAYLLRTEQVVHLDDLLLRRTLIGMLGETSLGLVAEIAIIAEQVLGWDHERVGAEIARTQKLFLERHQIKL